MGLSNSQSDRILSEYSARRLFHENELKNHRAIAYNACPRIQDIDDEIAQLSAAQARKRILGSTEGQLEYSQKVTALATEKANLLDTYQFPADYLTLKYDCEICKDTGADGNKKCKCYVISATKLLYKASGLTNVLDEENFDSFDMSYYPDNVTMTFGGVTYSARENMENILANCRSYVANFESKKDSMFFTGQTGRGKTFMTHCIAKSLLDMGYSVVYQSANQFFDNLANVKFGYDSDDFEIADYFTEADLLIIDDLGTEMTNNFTNPRLFECINDRMMKGLGTIISTNLSLSEIRDRYSDRIYSRIMGNYSLLAFFGEDIRKQKLRKNN